MVIPDVSGTTNAWNVAAFEPAGASEAAIAPKQFPPVIGRKKRRCPR
jgi:hypothetical protein